MKKHKISLIMPLGLLLIILLTGCKKQMEHNVLFSDIGRYTSPDGETVVKIERDELKRITYYIEHETGLRSKTLKPQYQPIMCWAQDGTLWVNEGGQVIRFLDYTDKEYNREYKTIHGMFHGGNPSILKDEDFINAMPEVFKAVVIASLDSHT